MAFVMIQLISNVSPQFFFMYLDGTTAFPANLLYYHYLTYVSILEEHILICSALTFNKRCARFVSFLL